MIVRTSDNPLDIAVVSMFVVFVPNDDKIVCIVVNIDWILVWFGVVVDIIYY